MNEQTVAAIRAEAQRMIDNPGVYVCGDTNWPEASTIVVSIGGELWSAKKDRRLNPARFLPALTIAGPFSKLPAEKKS